MAGELEIFILDTSKNLWLAEGPFGDQIPPVRTPVDVTSNFFWAFSRNELLVLGYDSNLWLEQGPFGNLPWVESPEQFPPPAGQRWAIDGNVMGFAPWSRTGPFFVISWPSNPGWPYFLGSPMDPPLWLEDTNWHWRVQVDGNAQAAQVLAYSNNGPQEVFVLSDAGDLWQEFGPYGTVPLPTCFVLPATSCRVLALFNPV